MEIEMNSTMEQPVRIAAVCLDGITEYIISMNNAKKSSILLNLIEDLGYKQGEDVYENVDGHEYEAAIPLVSGFRHLTIKEADIFVTIWTQHYDSIPRNINPVMINSPIVIPDGLSELIRTSQTTHDYLVKKKGKIIPANSELDKWDFILLSKFIAPAIFLNLSEMHFWLEYMVGRLARNIVDLAKS